MKKILFIGNSHTFYNKMPEEIFAPMLISAGIEAEVSSITKGGEYLANHAKSDTVTGQRIDEALANNTYDVIILQEQGKNPIVNFDDFDAAVHTLDKKVKDNGAKTVLYATYARKLGHRSYENLSMTPEEMSDGLLEAYRKVGKSIGAPVAPVALAFKYVVNNYPQIELYDADLLHPSYLGSVLTAMTILCTVFECSTDAIKTDLGVDSDTLEILKLAVRESLK